MGVTVGGRFFEYMRLPFGYNNSPLHKDLLHYHGAWANVNSDSIEFFNDLGFCWQLELGVDCFLSIGVDFVFLVFRSEGK